VAWILGRLAEPDRNIETRVIIVGIDLLYKGAFTEFIQKDFQSLMFSPVVILIADFFVLRLNSGIRGENG